MKLEYDYLYKEDDTKHGVKDADTGLHVAAIYTSSMSFKGTKTQDDKAAEKLAKVFAASLDMLDDLKMAVEVLRMPVVNYQKLENLVAKINATLNKTL